MNKTWLVTGCSSGFGREIASRLLQLGYNVTVTARDTRDVADLAERYPQTALLVPLDVMVSEQIEIAVAKTLERFGGIDVLVNNAGIGYFGSLEETDLNEARKVFETNVWGLVTMTRSVLPHMRAKGHGTIVNMSSMVGLSATPSLGFYSASKFAVEGLSEALSQEISALGLKVLIVEPGPFRTDFAGRSAAEAESTIDDYTITSRARQNAIRGYSGKQPGDPAKAAQSIIDAVEHPNPPLRLILGKTALTVARAKIEQLQQDFNAWESVCLAADFAEDDVVAAFAQGGRAI